MSLAQDVLQDYLDGKYEDLYERGLLNFCRYVVVRAIFDKIWKNYSGKPDLVLPQDTLIADLPDLDDPDKLFLTNAVCRNKMDAYTHNQYLMMVGGRIFMKKGYDYFDPKTGEKTEAQESAELKVTLKALHELISVSEVTKDHGRWIKAFAVIYTESVNRTTDEKALLGDLFMHTSAKIAKAKKRAATPVKEVTF